MNENLLKQAIEMGIIDLASMQREIEMRKKEEFLKKHPYKIWQGKDGKWRTYLPEEESGRKLIKKSSKEAVENEIVKYWRKKEENPTVKDIYEKWSRFKLESGEISWQTKNRYDRQFAECFGEFADRKIKTVRPFDIVTFIKTSIKENELTRKGYGNLKTLVFGIFKYAKDMELIDFSITQTINDMEISRKVFRKTKKTDEEKVFLKDCLKDAEGYILEHMDLINLGLFLDFKTGIRPGELAGLEWADVKSDTLIHIQRTEINYSTDTEKNIYEVREDPKTEAGNRYVYIPEKYSWIIRKLRELNPNGKYVFEINGERVKTYQFSQRLETICKRINTVRKSPNKIRKTYATILLDSKIADSVVTSQMGHCDIATTRSNYYANRQEDERQDIINSIF